MSRSVPSESFVVPSEGTRTRINTTESSEKEGWDEGLDGYRSKPEIGRTIPATLVSRSDTRSDPMRHGWGLLFRQRFSRLSKAMSLCTSDGQWLDRRMGQWTSLPWRCRRVEAGAPTPWAG